MIEHLQLKVTLYLLVLVAQSCPTICDPIDCSPPGSSVPGILQARKLKWVVIPFSRGSSRPRNRTYVSFMAGRFFTIWATRNMSTLMYDRLTLETLVLQDLPVWDFTLIIVRVNWKLLYGWVLVRAPEKTWNQSVFPSSYVFVFSEYCCRSEWWK